MASHEEPNTISRFRWLIVCFAKAITSKELKAAKSLVKDRLGDENYKAINDTFDFFDKLQEGNHFHEGDTGLLRHLLHAIGRNDLIEELNKYNSEYAVIARHYRKHPAASEGPFIGRKDRLDELFGLLSEEKHGDGVTTICISGLPGMGKTRLAKEACYRQIQYHKLLFVDLRELSSTESIFNAVLHTIGEDTTSMVDIDVLILKLKKYKPEAGGAVLLFDNADRPLRTPKDGVNNDMYKNFVELIKRIIECRNTCLKVLITTRMGLPRTLCTRYQDYVFPISIKADELDYEDAKDILQYYAGRTNISDAEAEQLIHLCGKCPLALKVTGSRLQDHTIPPKKLIEYLEKRSDEVTQLRFCGDVNLEACLKNTINSLPDDQKFRMVRLATVPGTFTSRAAMAILGMKRSQQVEVNLQLQDLKYRNLIETSIEDNEDFSKSDVRYGMHLLMKQFLQKIAETDKSVINEYKLGEQEFVGYFVRKLIKIGELSETKYKKAMKRKNEDAANFQEVLKHLPKQKRSITTDEWQVISTTMELFYSTEERLKFFKAQRELEYKSHNLLQFVEMSAYESLQMSKMNYRYEEILPLLERAEEKLLKIKKPKETLHQTSFIAKLFKKKYFAAKHVNSLTDAEKEKLVLLYQLWGNVCNMCSKDFDQANERIYIAYDLLKELNLMNTNTARFYSTMADLILNKSRHQNSGALCGKSQIKKALEFYRKAYELRKELTKQSEHHPDIPVYLTSIGSCYYQLEDGENAIKYYRRSLHVADEMVIDNEEDYLKTLRNLALAYRDVKRYDDAIDFGEKCAAKRWDLLGIHKDTARTYYLLGLFYMERKKKDDMKSSKEHFDKALEIEEQLWKQGKPHSVDWGNLKDDIKFVLSRITEQKMNYPEYERRFKEAEKKLTETMDESVDESKVLQMEKSCRKRRHSNSSDSDDEDNGISSMASFKGGKFKEPTLKARKENLLS